MLPDFSSVSTSRTLTVSMFTRICNLTNFFDFGTHKMFKESFKYYKSKCSPPDYKSVIDFDENNRNSITVRQLSNIENVTNTKIRGLLPLSQWKVYEINDRPGLIFIKNPFTKRGQRYWIARCLRDYPKAPHVVNLNSKYFNKNVIDDWWTQLQALNSKDCEKEKLRLKNGMRWTTLGYHHDWDTKVYAEEKKHKFPDDLAKLSAFFANALGFDVYSAEAAIVNFYPLGTTLAGHTDHSEKNLNAPLFSFSFGQTAIFLLGGKSKDEKPTALFLKSGDIVVMSKESRLCYHAVPKIINTDINWIHMEIDEEKCEQESNDNGTNIILNSVPKKRRITISNEIEYDDGFSEDIWNKTIDQTQWKPFGDYINECRININVRQVLDNGEITL